MQSVSVMYNADGFILVSAQKAARLINIFCGMVPRRTAVQPLMPSVNLNGGPHKWL